MNELTKRFTAGFIGPLVVAFVLTAGVMSGPLMAQQNASEDTDDQTNSVVVPTFWFIQADNDSPTLSTSDYLSKNNNQKVEVTSTQWDLIANNRGDTEVSFKTTKKFENQSDTSIKRDVELEITGGSGSWSGVSTTSDNIGSESEAEVSSTVSSNLAFGTIDLAVKFIHETTDQPSNADSNIDDDTNSAGTNYYAPDGTYKTTVTGTISAP